jgi:hypothetical protein
MLNALLSISKGSGNDVLVELGGKDDRRTTFEYTRKASSVLGIVEMWKERSNVRPNHLIPGDLSPVFKAIVPKENDKVSLQNEYAYWNVVKKVEHFFNPSCSNLVRDCPKLPG